MRYKVFESSSILESEARGKVSKAQELDVAIVKTKRGVLQIYTSWTYLQNFIMTSADLFSQLESVIGEPHRLVAEKYFDFYDEETCVLYLGVRRDVEEFISSRLDHFLSAVFSANRALAA